MKLRVSLLLLAFALPASALAVPAVLTGTFATRIAGKAPPLNGSYKLKLKIDGKFELTRNGVVVVRGLAAGVGGKLAIRDQSGPYRCKGAQRAAIYSYTLRGRKLTLKAVAEPCAGRKIVLTTRSFTKE